MRFSMYLAAAALLVAACNDDKPAGKPSPSAPKARETDPAIADMVKKRAQDDLKELTDKLAAKTVSLSDCVVVVYLDDLEPVDATLAGKLRRLCSYDVPVSLIENGVGAAETARKAKPDAITLPECDINVGLAIEQLEKASTIDDKARALIGRYDAACPMMAQVRADRAKRKAAGNTRSGAK